MKRYSIEKNCGVELNLPKLYIDYNRIGMISAFISLFWAYFISPNGLSTDQLTYLSLEKYILIAICFIVYKKIMYKMAFPYKIKVVEDGIMLIFSSGKSKKIETAEFSIDGSVNSEALDKMPYIINKPVKLITELNGRFLFVVLDEEEVSKLKE